MNGRLIPLGAIRRALLILAGALIIAAKLSADVRGTIMIITRNGDEEATMLPWNSNLARKTTAVLRGATMQIRESTVERSETENTATMEQNNATTASSPYAYAFVIGGCNPNKPAYRGFVYNILVAARILRDQGSTADIVAFFQLSYEYKSSDVLPEEDVRALEGLNVHIYYMPKSPHESFYETVMNKFRILALTQYRRVLLMDGDVMPVTNVDYLFELSDDNKYGPGNSTLKKNIVVSGPFEPSNAGFFMLTPGEGEYEKIDEIIHSRQRKAKDLDGVKFDPVEGWGHVIEEPDEWVSRKHRGRNWTFHFAFSDQGLLYHWTKYVKKDVSIIFDKKVENWGSHANGTVTMDQELKNPFKDYSKPLVYQYAECKKFMCDFLHHSGKHKPWLGKPPKIITHDNRLESGIHLWWHTLMEIDRDLGMGLDFENWQAGQRPALGFYATWRDMDKHIEKTKD